MALLQKTKFGVITIPVPHGTALEDIAISIDSADSKADLELGDPSYTSSIANSILSIKPNKVWLSGINIDVTISGTPYKDSFRIAPNRYYYDPEQYLYSRDIYDTVTDEQLVTNALATETETELLSSMGPKLTILWDTISSLLCHKFIYDNTTPNLRVCRLVAFRRMQQIALSLGLESLVESILFSPGPNRDWFRSAYIVSAKEDSKVLESLEEIQRSISELRNTMTLARLNTDVIQAVDAQISSSSKYHTLAKYLITLFCAIRYTHDNPKFSY